MTLPDVQNTIPEIKLDIQQVGIKEVLFPVRIRTKTGYALDTVATVAASVWLPASQKGTHMSRFIEVLNLNRSLDPQVLGDIANRLLSDLDATTSYLEIKLPYFIEKKAPATGAAGLMDYKIGFRVTAKKLTDRIEHQHQIRIEVPCITLCPCSKEISEHGAHNQRAIIRLVATISDFIWVEDLIALLESCASCQVYSVLKRPDEKYVTEASYNNPMFVEDVVRKAAQALTQFPQITAYTVEVESVESIHNHSAFARICNPARGLTEER